MPRTTEPFRDALLKALRFSTDTQNHPERPQAAMGTDQDRRKYSRIATDQVISFAPVDARDLLGVSRNVSPGGIRFEAVGCEIDLGDVLRLTFNVGEHTVVAVGQVVWATEMDPITIDVGIEFLEIDPTVLSLLEEAAGTAGAL